MGPVVMDAQVCKFTCCAHVKVRPQSSSGNMSQKLHYKASLWNLMWSDHLQRCLLTRKPLHTNKCTCSHMHMSHTHPHTHCHEDTTTSHGLQRIHQIFVVIATKTSYLDVSRLFPGTPEWERWFQTVSHDLLLFLNSFLSKGKATLYTAASAVAGYLLKKGWNP